jgi:pyrroloquinoline quinone (PQQ) biosynthesis protein C
MNFIEKLKDDVKNHSVLKSEWLLKRKKNMSKEDLILWLTQEYFVSVEFVNWFLNSASLTKNISAKIILVENIWEELGEGKKENAHVSILAEFLSKIGIKEEEIKILPETKMYLDIMKKITTSHFLKSLGALGPANEYLLKLEYLIMFDSYKILKEKENLPDSKFFQINLTADESHSEKLFNLIEKISITDEEKNLVINGNLEALDARKLFYIGLSKLD